MSYASAGLEWANACDTPFRKFKAHTHEGGIATPLIAHWPRGIAARGELRHQVGHVVDLMPTLLELAGGTYPAVRDGAPVLPIDGRSLVPAFGDSDLPRGPLFWEHEGHRAVLRGHWKAVAPPRSAWELYDLQTDRTERRNLASRRPELVRELAELWTEWAPSAGVRDWDELIRHRREQKGRAR